MSTSSSGYKKAVGGKLVLKGSSGWTKQKKKKKTKTVLETKEEDDDTVQQVMDLTKKKGKGRIITSGTTVMGKEETKFLHQLVVGDAIIIQHPTTFQEETRIVKMVLSDVSISISSPFSTDLITSTTFEFITAPKSNIVPIPASTVKTISDTDLAFGTYAGGTEKGTTVTYRVRKKTAYGGYTLIKETATEDLSREELLDRRTKRKGDRHCS